MIPLEDSFADIVGKALRGLGMSHQALAQKAGISVADVERLLSGSAEEELLRKVAPPLGLNAQALIALARGEWRPEEVGPVPGLACFNTHFEDMTVNSYLVWDTTTKEAAIFDTGADCTEMLEAIRANDLVVQKIFLTHTHPDHIAALDRLKEATGAPVYTSALEPVAGAIPIEEGFETQIGRLHLKTFLTNGHSPGGLTYYITGGPRRLAIVGDSIFAGSMGGGNVSYAKALENNRTKILTLPEDTVICPGHGPLTTVGEEKRHNPFFA
jgi:hydroxyacylglutathione hydrolase